MPNTKAIKDKDFYSDWAVEHDFCQCCGIHRLKAQFERWPGLSTHHMVKPGRSDERCNLLRLCERCHACAEMETRVDGKGQKLPYLPLGVCLTIKQLREPEDVDLERLEYLYGQKLPVLEPYPQVYQDEFAYWRPWDIRETQ